MVKTLTRDLLGNVDSRGKWRTRPLNEKNEQVGLRTRLKPMMSVFSVPLKPRDAVKEEMPCAKKRYGAS